MAFSIIREMAKAATEKKELNEGQLSSDNFIFFGNNGKSTIAASLSELTTEPVLMLSPAGASAHLSEQFPNAIFYTVNGLAELKSIILDLEKNMEIIKKIKNNLAYEARLKIIKEEFAKEYDKADLDKASSDWTECYNLAKNGRFPISAIVLEEIDIISSWIQDVVEAKMNLSVIGSDKKNMSADWAELKTELMNFYSKILKLPVRTIFCTSDKIPKEQQNLDKIIPNIALGQTNRLLLNLVGNVFYTNAEKNKYTIRLVGNSTIFIKSKFVPIKYGKPIIEELDVTGDPSKFWTYIDEVKNSCK